MATLTESAAHSKSRLALSVRFATIVYFSCLVCISEPRSVCGPPTDHLVKYAVVTMVGGSPGYIVGANVLLYSMLGTMDRGVRRHTQFIVLVTNHKTPAEKKTLSPLWTVCEPPLIGNASSKTVMFEKLWVYQLLDYERVLFLDADTFAVGDVSPLLTTPGLGAIAVTPDWFENVVPKPGSLPPRSFRMLQQLTLLVSLQAHAFYSTRGCSASNPTTKSSSASISSG